MTGLSAIRAEVAASVAATQALVQQTQSGSSLVLSAQAALVAASEAARRTTTDFMHDYYDRHLFDRYLKFASTEDEEEYRRREQERKAAIEKAQAEHTPQGDLRANKLAIEQLKDAGAHGADQSPDYKPELDRLKGSQTSLERAIGQPAKAAAQDRISAATSGTADAPGNAGLSPDLIAGLKNVGITPPSQIDGHGVAACDAKAAGARCPG